MSDAPPQYVINPLAPFPRRWLDQHGPLRVMCEPVEGYVLARRPHAAPFAIHVRVLLNTDRHPTHGPFTVVEKAKRR